MAARHVNARRSHAEPGQTDECPGTARLYLDAATSEAQQKALEAIMQGTKGGPMEIVRGLMSTYLPTQCVPLAIQEANGTITATVGAVGQITSQRLTNE